MPTFPNPFVPRYLKKSEEVEHLDAWDGTEDLSTMILLSVMRTLRTISTTATALMIPLCSFCPKKGWSDWTYEGTDVKLIGISNVSFLSRNLYWEFCETHSQSPLVQIQTLFVQFVTLCYSIILTSLKLYSSQWNVNTSC